MKSSLRPSSQPFDDTQQKSSALPTLLCWLLILTFALFFSLLSLQQHATFQTNGLDLGNVDQALWNTAQGRFLHFTLMTPLQSRLALHVEPILLFFVPFYWLNLGGPKLLLITQATLGALGAWPLYQLAKTNLPSPLLPLSPAPLLALIFPLAYLLLPTLQAAVLFEFHAVTLAPTFFLFAFLALEQKKDRRFVTFLVLAMACKEDMPLVVVMVGLYAGLGRGRWRLAGVTIALSLAWFVMALFVIQPSYAVGGNIQLGRYAWLGDNPLAMGQTLLTQPGLIVDHLWHRADLPSYVAWLLFPTAFLALFSPLTLLPMLPTLAVNLLSDNPFTWRLEDFHYGAPLAPFLFISAIHGIKNLSHWANLPTSQPPNPPTSQPPNLPISLLIPLLTLLLLVFTLIYHHYRGFTPFGRPFIWPEVTAHHRQLEALIQTIPPNAALFSQSNLAPHLTQRPIIYTNFAYFTDPDFPAPTPVEDIILDVTTFENIGGLHQFLREALLESGAYELVAAQEGLLHLKPSPAGSPTPISSLPPSFYTFAQPSPAPTYPLRVDFNSLVRLHGYSLHFNRQEEVQVTLDIEPLQPLSEVQPVLYLLDAHGEPTSATTDLQPGLIWFPVNQWPVGQTVRLRFNTFPWYTRQTEQYRLALGLISGDDVWDIGHRHRPQIATGGDLALRLPAEGALLEVARFQQIWRIPQGGPLPRQFSAPILSHASKSKFDRQVELLGYTLAEISTATSQSSPSENAGPRLSITLAWRAITAPAALIRFVQLIGPDSLVYGQSDSAPDLGHYPTSLWQPGEVVVETVTFPLAGDRPSGPYTLHVGLYHPDTGQRLLLPSGADHVEIPISQRAQKNLNNLKESKITP